jgi:hypothetical protein
MPRAQSLPVAVRQAPPKPMRPPAARYVRFVPHARERARRSRAAMPVSASCQAGVLATPSSSPRTYAFHFSKPTVRAATYASSYSPSVIHT